MKRPDVDALFADFDKWHTDPRNRLCHDFGIPLVTLPVLGALSWVTLGATLPFVGPIDLALVLLAATFVFDLFFAWRLAPAVLLIGLGLWAVGRALPPWALGVVFAAGWVCQLGGHRVLEKNAPAFTTNLVHLVVGPRWLVRRWFRLLGGRR